MITHIFSISFATQRVPKIWKTANGWAILTKTNISPLDQLRPISVNDHLKSWSSNEPKPVLVLFIQTMSLTSYKKRLLN